ncbi:V-type proton ATPase 116 kDa subunit a 1-like isoform X2 [Apostichopus japonicus]|uniref:V-type proton ATPase 116 kDa subunit a 1-like isoform X2 n=1 Tax=Stichopus japonicus TaxID=307972 RepID=UPI003AB6830F
MGSLFRSEEMCKAQLFLQSEAAFSCVSELGELGLVQFRDLNPDVNAFRRKFVNEVRRCDEMERKLRYLEREILKSQIPIPEATDNPEAPAPREMIDLESNFEKLENESREVNSNQEALKRNFLELTELKHILRKTQHFFDEMHDADKDEESHTLLGEEGPRIGQAMRLGFVAGVIERGRLAAFEQMLWRVCRGNVFLRLAEIEEPLEDPSSGDEMLKNVFIIFFQGDQLKSRVKKICEGFRAMLYPCPESQSERREMALGVMTRIEDFKAVLVQTDEHRSRVLSSAARKLSLWFIKVRKLKAIYHTLNLFNLDVTQKCLIAECWCPVADLSQIQIALRRGTERSGSSVQSILNRVDTDEAPPTYNKTNKFTSVFQSIVDSYGVSTYREVNPAPYAIITFPFLFSVMFGDLGHGAIMAIFALWMILREKPLANTLGKNEMLAPIYGGRYIIFLMGLFSIYAGFIYNDLFSKSVNIFGSSWNVSGQGFSEADLESEGSFQLNPVNTTSKDYIYPFGIDPIWQVAINKLSFLNSFKMKISVIFGVTQMTFGVFLSFLNHSYFRSNLNIFCQFIPEMIFLLSIFGYLVFMIVAKWFFFDATSSGQAPSLIITLIDMVMLGGADPPLYGDGTLQSTIQTGLIAVAVICAPWMLFVKPFILKKQNDRKVAREGHLPNRNPAVADERSSIVVFDELQGESETDPPPKYNGKEDQAGPSHSGGGHEEEEFEFGEVFVHQAIHTIEFCLGCVSHTASYLRLWALSLAHAELSEVLWTMLLGIGLGADGPVLGTILIWATFAVWATLTIGILLFMEGLSAFLHTLRLHWVEFQSKFFRGEGYAFCPFSFKVILENRDD